MLAVVDEALVRPVRRMTRGRSIPESNGGMPKRMICARSHLTDSRLLCAPNRRYACYTCIDRNVAAYAT
jgi:hypothetical protein